MKIHTSVVMYLLHLIQCCISNGSLECTQFRFYREQRIYKAEKKSVSNLLECAAINSIEGEIFFSYNPHLRLCIMGTRGSGTFSASAIPDDEKRWISYLEQTREACVKEVEEQHPDAKGEKVDVLYNVKAENGTLVVLRYHIAMLKGDTPSAKVTFSTSVLIPDAETVCYNKGNNKLYIIYNRRYIQELFSREGIQGTDVRETSLNRAICGRAKILRIDHRSQKFFFATHRGICVWDPTSLQKLIIKNNDPWRMELDTHKKDIYFIAASNKVALKSNYEGTSPILVCFSSDMVELAVDQRDGLFYTCTIRDGIGKRCTLPIDGVPKQECMSMVAWNRYLFMVNKNGLLEFVSLEKKFLVKTNHSYVAGARRPCNIQVLQDD